MIIYLNTYYFLEGIDLSGYYIYNVILYIFDGNATYIHMCINVRALTGVINIRSTKRIYA